MQFCNKKINRSVGFFKGVFMVTALNVKLALERLGVKEGDSIITHSSFKSVGELENGAATIVEGMRAAVGESGTVLFPTLCQEPWDHIYENWHMDAHSDIGYLTNFFRKLPEAKRSNQATHSVAAIGKDAEYFTKTHGESGKRYGIFGDTPFSADSPWEKMYERDTKIVFLGVGIRKCTFRHYAEYCVIEDYLKRAEKSPRYEEVKAKIWTYEKEGKYVWDQHGLWPHVDSEFIEPYLLSEGKIKKTYLGAAPVMLISSRDFVDKAKEMLYQRYPGIISGYAEYSYVDMFKWFEEVDNL